LSASALSALRVLIRSQPFDVDGPISLKLGLETAAPRTRGEPSHEHADGEAGDERADQDD